MMKLFDRSVDLAQFNEKTPLYPIARAWMNSNSQEDTEGSQQDDTEEEVTLAVIVLLALVRFR